ncbi:hypothetical protein S40293_07627 [Stachybotrys chartarum IBT 40293]|nr:hypothetical protein S40293_07627 [Stachybotrys chartarum IBT 40293]
MATFRATTALQSIINHVFLPPHLPSGEDGNSWIAGLFAILHTSLLDFLLLNDGAQADSVRRAIVAMNNLDQSRDDLGTISEYNVTELFTRIRQKDGPVPLHIVAQNAGVLVWPTPQEVIFETFELSPPNLDVYRTSGRLRRHFPDAAVTVPFETFEDSEFIKVVAQTLATMSHQSVSEMQPRAMKANKDQIEERGTVEPFIVNHLFLAIVRSLGGAQAQVATICKNTREEVMWSHGNKLPWRRSPIWLLIRVTLERTLSPPSKGAGPNDCILYKRFMIFFLSKILQQCLQANMESDMLSTMNAKLYRRLVKLDTHCHSQWLGAVGNIMQQCRRTLDERWNCILNAHKSKLRFPIIGLPRITQNLAVRMPELSLYLIDTTNRSSLPMKEFRPPRPPIWRFEGETLPIAKSLVDSNSAYNAYNLAAFENWVATNLEIWWKDHGYHESSCEMIESLIRSYVGCASTVYQDNPEGMSIMFLTVLDLWIACDKSVIENCALIASYKAEIPIIPWGSLLLKSAADLRRLLKVETYLNNRNQRARFHRSALYDIGCSDDFGAQFFATSLLHQTLLREIEEDACKARAAKREELQSKKRTYRDLMDQYQQLYCTYHTVTNKWGDETQIHYSGCQKHLLLKKAQNMRIQAHEWPLPTDPAMAQAVVFELQVPNHITSWRNCTLFVLQAVFQLESQDLDPSWSCFLEYYSELRKYHRSSMINASIVLCSEAKPHALTHRRETAVSMAEESDVCLETGPRWGLFDNPRARFLRPLQLSDYISSSCTLQLPQQSKSLQFFLTRIWREPDGADPNCVIAKQHTCPPHFSTDEFKALCSVGLGCHTQWLNILVQLAMPSIDLNKIETFLFIWQVAEQCGPSSGAWRRTAHARLQDSNFICVCLENLHRCLDRVKESWESRIAVGCCVLLGTRLLSLCLSGQQAACLSFLSKCRRISYEWQGVIREKASTSQDSKFRLDFSQRAYEAALVCLSSFDVDDEHVTHLLDDAQTAKIYFGSLLNMHDTAFSASDENILQKQLRLRCCRLIRRYHHISQTSMTEIRANGLDLAVQTNWTTFQRSVGSAWQMTEMCWLHSNCKVSGIQLDVHINVITGELLVNGLPRGRLPIEYEQHPTYKLLFGHAAFEALPVAEPGMQFAASKTFRDFQLQFLLNESSNDLVVRAKKNGQTWELLPKRLLKDYLPFRFYRDYVFWYNSNTSFITLRRKETPWEEDSRLWTMSQTTSDWKVQDIEGNRLVFPTTWTAETINTVFEPMETIFGLDIVFKPQTGSIEIDIPRLRLDFFIESGSNRIQSRQFRGMHIDEAQELETLVGLQNRLVLCSSGQKPIGRIILVPDGTPSAHIKALGNGLSHTTVQISNTAASTQAYSIDTHLGQLKGNGSLKSRLFLAELHAMTSSCVPDPLTGHTGTEEALEILNSAAVRSFVFINTEEVEILERLSKLAPTRTFYPVYLEEMQDVSWKSCISPLAQSDSFAVVTRDLQEQAIKHNFLLPVSRSMIELKIAKVDQLTRRGLARALAPLMTKMTSPEVHPDIDYKRHVSEEMRTRTLQAVRFGSALRMGGGILSDSDPILSPSSLYSFLTNKEGWADGSQPAMSSSDLRFDARYLENHADLLSSMWCKFHWILTNIRHDGRLPLVPWLATLAFAPKAEPFCLQALLAFVTVADMNRPSVPRNPHYDLGRGREYKSEEIMSILDKNAIDFHRSSEFRLPQDRRESNQSAVQRRKLAFRVKLEKEKRYVEAGIRGQWPGYSVYYAGTNTEYFPTMNSDTAVGNCFRAWFDNLKFYQYLTEVCEILGNADKISIDLTDCDLIAAPYFARQDLGEVDLMNLLNKHPAPKAVRDESRFHHDVVYGDFQGVPCLASLRQLVERLSDKTISQQESEYIAKLNKSIACLSKRTGKAASATSSAGLRVLIDEFEVQAQSSGVIIRDELRTILSMGVHGALDPEQLESSWQAAALTHQWPRLSTRQILGLMRHGKWQYVPLSWKKTITEFAMGISDLQSIERLSRALHEHQTLAQELASFSPRSWDPIEYPDSLLLEVEGNMRIRQVQDKIATDMRGRRDKGNVVMQLNMGEGKSAVIVPIVAASLANSSRLVRVVVAKPQSRQMWDILVSKLGGLMGRRIYQMPLSRSTKLNISEVQTLMHYYEQCARDAGVMLVQPEHLLSFQLMTIEVAIQQERKLGKALWELHEFLDSNSRDIVDESDENFSTKFELIYTMGNQRSIEHGPDRWIIIQEVLGLIAEYARGLKEIYPKGIELDEKGRSSFPLIRFLDAESSTSILRKVAEKICSKGISGFPISYESEEMRAQLLNYIFDTHLNTEIQDSVEAGRFWDTFSKNLLLVRGLFAGGILEFVFRHKRWRVNYGLDFERVPSTRLVVPYRAKDSPSPRSEFSHPDVVICLTCLSYYYGGLSDDDQTLSLQYLLQSDQANIEFQEWVDTSDGLPASFRHVKSINLQDREQCVKSVFPSFRYSKGAVDYFLSHLVFNREMKEFPYKLSASGWDIGRKKTHPLTGFSGTNDSQHVLPVSVTQLELKGQEHTNALVLGQLMRPENSVVSLMDEGFGGICHSRDFLNLVTRMQPQVRVVLDVGALVLDMTNEQFAHEWLRVSQGCEDIEAVVFCSSGDDVCVLDRRGHVQLLATSPYAAQLDRCVAFLDEAHTRGIDLRLPADYRAAVTLGANLTKDRLVQACMRMRKLAVGQSVVFCVPEEIETKIREMTENNTDTSMSVPDVLAWAIHGTWTDLQRSMPLWFQQGKTFAKHKLLWDAARAEEDNALQSGDLAERFLEDEAKSLEERYRPRTNNTLDISGDDDDFDTGITNQILQRCKKFEGLNLLSGVLQEEQERELAPEIEEEKQLELPAPATPAHHALHPDVMEFIETGKIKRTEGDDAFLRAFDILGETTAAKYFDLKGLPQTILVTQDFKRTIQNTSTVGSWKDNYQRVVQWVLTDRRPRNRADSMVILSPYEANKLMPHIEASSSVILHVFAPQHNKEIRPLDDLKLFTIPIFPSSQRISRRMTIELMLFSGQLYFRSYKQYVAACNYLCLAHEAASGRVNVRSDGFIDPASHGLDRDPSTILKESPVRFLKMMMTRIRRPCESIEKTHVGRMLEGGLLTADDFVVAPKKETSIDGRSLSFRLVGMSSAAV